MSASRPAAVLILAAGKSTRLKSKTPKFLHELCGRRLVDYVLTAAAAPDPHQLVVVVGHGRDELEAHLRDVAPDAETVLQDPQNGTGHAVRVALEKTGPIAGTVLVTYGDTPLLRGETLTELTTRHAAEKNAATVLTAEVADPAGYGRIVRDADGEFASIVEHKDATDAQRAIKEINSGVYVFDGELLAAAIGRITAANAQGEEYLTDVIGILRADGNRVGTFIADDPLEIEGVNDQVQMAAARRALNDRILTGWMRAGVAIYDPASVFIDADVTLEPDATILPNTQLHGATHVASGATVGPGCTLTGTSVGEEATVVNAVCVGAQIGLQVSVGPFAYLRPGTVLARGAKAGTYVEMKNAVVGEGSKVPHLTYVGDAEIGEGCNIGASAIFVNYDGVNKHKTVIGDNAFIGCDTMLVAPRTVGDGAYTAAGSVIVSDVPPGSIAVARARQRNVEGWVERKRPGTASAAAARRALDEAATRAGEESGADDAQGG